MAERKGEEEALSKIPVLDYLVTGWQESKDQTHLIAPTAGTAKSQRHDAKHRTRNLGGIRKRSTKKLAVGKGEGRDEKAARDSHSDPIHQQIVKGGHTYIPSTIKITPPPSARGVPARHQPYKGELLLSLTHKYKLGVIELHVQGARDLQPPPGTGAKTPGRLNASFYTVNMSVPLFRSDVYPCLRFPKFNDMITIKLKSLQDLKKRIYINVWGVDGSSHTGGVHLGSMAFSVDDVIDQQHGKPMQGWFYLFNDDVGKMYSLRNSTSAGTVDEKEDLNEQTTLHENSLADNDAVLEQVVRPQHTANVAGTLQDQPPALHTHQRRHAARSRQARPRRPPPYRRRQPSSTGSHAHLTPSSNVRSSASTRLVSAHSSTNKPAVRRLKTKLSVHGGPITGLYLGGSVGPAVITHVAPGSAAIEAGLRVGDQVMKVDGVDVSGLAGSQVEALLFERNGEPVVVCVQRRTPVVTGETLAIV